MKLSNSKVIGGETPDRVPTPSATRSGRQTGNGRYTSPGATSARKEVIYMDENLVNLLAKLGKEQEDQREKYGPDAVVAQFLNIRTQESIERFISGEHDMKNLFFEMVRIQYDTCYALSKIEERIAALENR